MSDATIDAATIQSWLGAAASGTLSTLLADARAPGFPFGTLVPFVLDERGAPVVVLSDLAVHTKNAKADPRASLLVSEPQVIDPQAGWRVTLVGRLRKLEGEEGARALAAFRARFPGPELPGFFAHVLDVEATRFIAGFGKMGWL